MLVLRSYWLALLLLSQEVCCPRRLVDPPSLVDWRCSYLCSKLIPSVIEKLVIFIKELSFPQTAPTDDAFFQPELGWSVFGLLGWSWADTGLVCRPYVVGPGVGLLLLLLLIGRLWMWYSPAGRTRRKKCRRELCPWPLRCLSQCLYERKKRLLRRLRIGVPFTDGVDMCL